MRVNFMIVGGMKCGTSSLAWLLSEHPDVCFSRPKEPNYFTEFQDWQSGLGRYHSMFKHKEARLYGEGSTSYSRFPANDLRLYRHIYEYNPEMKILYLLRHPVERTISHYKHLIQRGYTDLEFHASLSRDKIMEPGRYYTQISPYIDLFGMDNVLILKFEDFIKAQKKALFKTAAFLNIDPAPFSGAVNVIKNATSERKVLSVRQEAFFKRYIRPCKKLMSPGMLQSIKEKMISRNSLRVSRHEFKVTEDDQRVILHYTLLDIEKLQRIVDFDLSSYFQPVKL